MLEFHDNTEPPEKQDEIFKLSQKVKKTIYLAEVYDELGFESRAARVYGCGKQIKITTCSNGHRHIVGASFCRDRFCPACAWRRSRMLSGQVMQVVHAAAERERLRYIFLTLTIRNCPGEELPQTVDKLYDAWHRMFWNAGKKQKNNIFAPVRGWLRNLEVTKNAETGGFHPHLHILIAVKPSYFETGYINQKQWTAAWRSALGASYDPRVDVRAIRATTGRSMAGAACEVGKYSVKDSDYITGQREDDSETLGVLVSALYGRRLMAWGGIYRKIHKELHLTDTETGNIDIECEPHSADCPVCGNLLVSELLTWNFTLASYVSYGVISKED